MAKKAQQSDLLLRIMPYVGATSQIDGPDLRDTGRAEARVASQITTRLAWAREVELTTMHKPRNLELDPGLDQSIEVAAGVLQCQCVWVGQVLSDGNM